MNIQYFCKTHGISADQFYGKEKIAGYLDLRGLSSIPDGFNPTVGGSLDLSGLSSIPDGFNPTVSGYLDLSGLSSIPDGFNPTVGGHLDLSGLSSIPDGFNPTVGGYLDFRGLSSIPDGFKPTVGGYLDLSGLSSIPDGFNPTVGGYLDLSGLSSIPDGFNPTVGGHLYLSGLSSIPDGFNPTVGGDLYLSGLSSIPDGFNPTVGGYLYLSGLSSIPDGFNPTVCGYLYLRGFSIGKKKAPKTDIVFFQGGAYIKADGIFAAVVRKRGNVYALRKINSEKEFYLVTDGAFTHAHGETIKEAKYAFRFKAESERFKSEPITAEKVLTIHHYRAITGACDLGIKFWINENIPANRRDEILKNGIAVKELLPILEKTSAYGLARFKALIQ